MSGEEKWLHTDLAWGLSPESPDVPRRCTGAAAPLRGGKRRAAASFEQHSARQALAWRMDPVAAPCPSNAIASLSRPGAAEFGSAAAVSSFQLEVL